MAPSLDADEEAAVDLEPAVEAVVEDASRPRTAGLTEARPFRVVVEEEASELAPSTSSLIDEAGAWSSMLAGVAEREPVGVGLAWMAWRGELSAALLESMANLARRLPGPEREKVLGAMLVARVAGVAKGVLVDVGE